MRESSTPSQSLDAAIVGGSIIGVITALDLIRRGMHVTVYECATDFHEIGACIGFTGIARECMQRTALYPLACSLMTGRRHGVYFGSGPWNTTNATILGATNHQ